MFGRRTRVSKDDRGAVAVLACIVTTTMLLPVIALAVTAHVREGAAAELQRAAEAGALAGAASIPLGDISFVNAYAAGTPLSGFFVPGAPDPLTIACDQAKKAIIVDGSINDAFSPSGTTLPANFCKAEYSQDPTFLSRLGNCLNLSGILGSIPLLGGLLSGLLFGQSSTIVPGLLHAGVKVTLTRTVRGPFDSFVGGGATAQTAQAQAKRRFKNAVVLPDLGTGSSFSVTNAALSLVTDTTIALVRTLNGVINPLLAPLGCSNLLGLLADDLSDLLDPPTTAPTVGQVLNDAVAAGEQVLALRLPSNPLVIPLLGILPFYNFLPVCLTKASGTITALVQNPLPPLGGVAGCALNASGIFRASLVPVT